MSENLSPTDLIGLVNDYFTMIVKMIHSANGVLDKFIGDAAMAVFGLDDNRNSCNDAIESALNIRKGLVDFASKVQSARHALPV